VTIKAVKRDIKLFLIICHTFNAISPEKRVKTRTYQARDGVVMGKTRLILKKITVSANRLKQLSSNAAMLLRRTSYVLLARNMDYGLLVA
jgi:hypothetical protein